ncbi:type II toxin-antitoxin system HicB family antitoxin [Thermoanaerobacter sp. A7A]|uniref:type II toxin-antitoxin system HicB family antitoxin n=1 Tax=Thermoanaerobacter sp. A7A TaxID=1350366 RepID=UPI00041508AF|nr:type II toxin-antitoxin system HicB family antitoxin [Thermoanaerobacter sp. A7A]
MPNELNYRVEIVKLSEEDGGGYLAIVPRLHGCISDGETPEDALKNVQDAIKCWIKTAKEKGKKIPPEEEYREESEHSGKLLLRIPKSMHKTLSEMAEEEGVSLNNLIQNLLSFAIGYKRAKKDISSDYRPVFNDIIIESLIGKWKKVDNVELVN